MPRVGGGPNRGGGRTGSSRSGRIHSSGGNRSHGFNHGNNGLTDYNRHHMRRSLRRNWASRKDNEDYQYYEDTEKSKLAVTVFILPIAIGIITTIFMLVFMFNLTKDTGVRYNEKRFIEYAEECYIEEFKDSKAYEDNLLIVVLTDRSYNECYYISYVGNHIEDKISDIFGNENSEFGQMMNFEFSSNYRYSFDKDISTVMNTCMYRIISKKLEDSFTCDEIHENVDSYIVNKTKIEFDEAIVNESLNKFTEKTDIPVVIVLDNARNVFYPGLSNVTIFTGGLFLSMAALFTFLLIRAIKKKNDFYYED